MSKQYEVYRCAVCGAIVEVVQGGAGTLHCCGQPMDRMEEQETEAAAEKHVPVVQAEEGGYVVTVGSVAHPMQAEHYIQWIELAGTDGVQRHYLQPGDRPVAHFKTTAQEVSARAYCNLHGLWKQKK